MNNVILIRYGQPGKYDHGPYGAICKVLKAFDDKFDTYVQLATNESEPQWNYVGSFETDDEARSHVQKLLDK